MRTRSLLGSLALVLALLLGGCGDDGADASGSTLPDSEPTTVGVVSRAEADADPALTDSSDPYFEGMALLRGDPLIVDDATGEGLAPPALQDGAEVAVWTEGACAESYPVQCTVVAIEVRS